MSTSKRAFFTQLILFAGQSPSASRRGSLMLAAAALLLCLPAIGAMSAQVNSPPKRTNGNSHRTDFSEDFSSVTLAPKLPSSVIYEYTTPERMLQNVSIVEADDGALVVAWSNKSRDRHDNDPSNKVMVSRSADDGKSWSEPQVVDGVFSINPTFLKAPGGELWLFYNKNNSTTQDDTSIHYRRSTDHGRTWGEAARLDTGYKVEVIVHNGIVLSNGEMLVTFHYDRASKDTETYSFEADFRFDG